MREGQIITIYTDERTKTYPVGKFELLKQLNMGVGLGFSFWKAQNIETGAVGRYLLKNKNHEE